MQTGCTRPCGLFFRCEIYAALLVAEVEGQGDCSACVVRWVCNMMEARELQRLECIEWIENDVRAFQLSRPRAQISALHTT